MAERASRKQRRSNRSSSPSPCLVLPLTSNLRHQSLKKLHRSKISTSAPCFRTTSSASTGPAPTSQPQASSSTRTHAATISEGQLRNELVRKWKENQVALYKVGQESRATEIARELVAMSGVEQAEDFRLFAEGMKQPTVPARN